MAKGFIVEVKTSNPNIRSFVGNAPNYFNTYWADETKVWKTQTGAERWIAERGMNDKTSVREVCIDRKGNPVLAR